LRRTKLIEVREQAERVERAYLVGLQWPKDDPARVTDMLNELAELTRTLGLTEVGRSIVSVNRPRPRLLVGPGKAEAIIEQAREAGADVLVFDDPITPAQQRNWEQMSNLCVIDREEVILDIFADRAQTREAVLQVKLAQAEYDLPRLKRRWTHLSRQRGMRGGAGLRGEGEQQIELDARMIRNRIRSLRRQLEEVRRRRRTQRVLRERAGPAVAAIVGYTNAGKSSLLNALTESDVLVEDKLFATLDPVTRRVRLPDGRTLLLTDTVGFVRKLPHQLIEAFKATLEETATADVIIEIADMTSPDVAEHHSTTVRVLEELGAADRPRLLVFNKVDAAPRYMRGRLRRKYPGAVFISARTGEGLDGLLERIAEMLPEARQSMNLVVPHDHYDVIALLHRTGSVVTEKFTEAGVHVHAEVPVGLRTAVERFAT